MSEERKSTEGQETARVKQGLREAEDDLPTDDLEQLIRAAQAAVLQHRTEKREAAVAEAQAAEVPEKAEVEVEIESSPPVVDPELEQKVLDLQRELALRDEEVSQLKDRTLRLAAEFDNYKKRSRKERNDIVVFANEELIKQFLPVLDNFDRAIETGKTQQVPDSFFKGIELIYTQTQGLMERLGLKHIEVVGQFFDPNLHEAVMRDPNSDFPENTVSQEYRRGYSLNEKIIRQAMVSVSSRPSGAAVKPNEEPDSNAQDSVEAPVAEATTEPAAAVDEPRNDSSERPE